MEKVANDETIVPIPISESEMIKEAYSLSSLQGHLKDSMYEVDVRFQKDSDIFYDLVKQAYLGGTSFGDIQRAIRTVYDSPVVSTVLHEAQEKLAAELYPTKLAMEEKTLGSVNSENSIIKQAALLVKDTSDFLTLHKKIAEVEEEMQKLSKTFELSRAYFGKTASGIKKGLALLGAGAVGGAALHAHLQNVKEQQTNMPLSQGSGRYAR
jgi:hypothetical protein